jgi:hypothetical protein
MHRSGASTETERAEHREDARRTDTMHVGTEWQGMAHYAVKWHVSACTPAVKWHIVWRKPLKLPRIGLAHPLHIGVGCAFAAY